MGHCIARHAAVHEFCNKDGTRFVIDRADIPGVVHLERFVDVSRGIEMSDGFLRVFFVFGAEDGLAYTYFGVLHPLSLWPAIDDSSQISREKFKAEVTLKTVRDTRDLPPLRVTDGNTIKSAHKYNGLTFELRAEEQGVAVRLTVYVGDQVQGNEESYARVEYSIPLERLLWRAAPSLSDDDVAPEGEHYVDVKAFESLDTPAVQRMGLKPSAVRVTRASR